MRATAAFTSKHERENAMSGHPHHPRPGEEPYRGEAGFWAQPDELEVEGEQLAFQPGFYDIASLPGFNPAPGVQMNVMTGGAMMANWVRIDPGAGVPTHAHPHEQIGLVLEGTIEMTIAGETRTLAPGHAYTIPGHLPHSAVAGPDGCLVLDIFSPPREEYRSAASGS
jgi:quercetin dioxygenase-like cupin family protein